MDRLLIAKPYCVCGCAFLAGFGQLQLAAGQVRGREKPDVDTSEKAAADHFEGRWMAPKSLRFSCIPLRPEYTTYLKAPFGMTFLVSWIAEVAFK